VDVLKRQRNISIEYGYNKYLNRKNNLQIIVTEAVSTNDIFITQSIQAGAEQTLVLDVNWEFKQHSRESANLVFCNSHIP
jgi:hypothetical protein